MVRTCVDGKKISALGCEAGATPGEIRAAYKARLLIVHPDKGGTDEEFRRTHQAYLDAMAKTSAASSKSPKDLQRAGTGRQNRERQNRSKYFPRRSGRGVAKLGDVLGYMSSIPDKWWARMPVADLWDCLLLDGIHKLEDNMAQLDLEARTDLYAYLIKTRARKPQKKPKALIVRKRWRKGVLSCPWCSEFLDEFERDLCDSQATAL